MASRLYPQKAALSSESKHLLPDNLLRTGSFQGHSQESSRRTFVGLKEQHEGRSDEMPGCTTPVLMVVFISQCVSFRIAFDSGIHVHLHRFGHSCAVDVGQALTPSRLDCQNMQMQKFYA